MNNISKLTHNALERLKINELNSMQLASIKANENNDDVVLLAPTGSGKTLAFLLPLINRIEPATQGIQALILAPSRELSMQIEQVFKSMGTNFKVTCCYGGHSVEIEKKSLVQPPAVLIGTPGRVADHLKNKRIYASTIKMLVLDEFDKCLEFGFKDEMSFIISQLLNVNKRILTSATQSVEIPDFTGVSYPKTLNFLSSQQSTDLTLKAVISPSKDKLTTLFQLICKLGNKPTLVFCNHRESVERVADFLVTNKMEPLVFHGGLEQDVRERALMKFRNGSVNLLITTDLAARGLDIPEIEYIIHYHLPTTQSAFTHRNGRTARMHAKGIAYVILSKNEVKPTWYNLEPIIDDLPITNTLPPKAPKTTLYISAGKKHKITKTDIVGFLIQKGGLQKDELGLIDIQENVSYVAVNSDKIKKLLLLINNQPIKKIKVKFDIAK